MAQGFTQSGMQIAISTTVQNSDIDLAAFELLSYTDIPNVGNVSDLDPTHDVSEYPTLAGGVIKQKGRFNAGTFNFEVAYDSDDAGQAAAVAATASTVSDNYAMRITYQSGDIRFVRAIIMPGGEPGGDDTAFVVRRFICGMNQNDVYKNAD